jgi:hypothetical protein
MDEKSQWPLGGGGGFKASPHPPTHPGPASGPVTPLPHQFKMTLRSRKGAYEAETRAEATGRGADSQGFHFLCC